MYKIVIFVIVVGLLGLCRIVVCIVRLMFEAVGRY